MTIGQHIKEARKSARLTQRELAEKAGVATGTIQQYELGKRQPRLEQLKQIAATLNVPVSYFWDLESTYAKKAPSLPDEALKVAKDYNGLDTHGKSVVRLLISEEQRRMDEEATPSNVIPFAPKKKTTHKGMVTIEVFEEPSAAGTGNYVSDSPASHMEQYSEEDIHSQADFGVVISGRSMEPKYPDKAVVFVKSTQVVEPGEVGIFLLDGQTYIKQLQVDPETGEVFLHSLNPEFSDIKVAPYVDFRPQGKVLGGFDPSTGKVIWK